jgi:hypothetical protein
MTQVKLPRIVGVNQLADETALAVEDNMFVRKAVNVDIDSRNNVSRRKGATLQLAGTGYHSMYETSRGWTMLCRKNELGRYDTATATFLPMTSMTDAYTTSFTEVNRVLYAMNPSFSCMFLPTSGTPKPIGVPLPSIEVEFRVIASGDMEEGTYGVAYTLVDPDGEESGLSKLVTLDLEAGQGIGCTMLMVLSGYRYRFYMTTANGSELRQAAEIDADTTSLQILAPEEGRQAETQGLEPPPFGNVIRGFNARLLIGTLDGYVYYTEAFRPHLYHPDNFVSMQGYVTLLEPVGNGVFIGDRTGVYFYKGQDPTEWSVELVSPERAIFNTGQTISGAYFGGELANYDTVAIWLTESGYLIGLPSGEILRPNAGQVKLPAYTQGCSTVLIRDGRKQVLTAVNSNKLVQTGAALDSTTI